MKTLLTALIFTAASFAQATFPIQVPGESAVSVTISAEAVTAVTAFIKSITVAPAAAITLNGSINAAVTTVNVSSSASIKTGMGIGMDSEIALVTAINSNALTVARAALGTSAASHTTGAGITLLRSGSYSAFIADIVGDTIKNAMEITPGPLVISARASIATAQGTIDSTKTAGVGHTP